MEIYFGQNVFGQTDRPTERQKLDFLRKADGDNINFSLFYRYKFLVYTHTTQYVLLHSLVTAELKTPKTNMSLIKLVLILVNPIHLYFINTK